jgi:4-amino-4-deoxy-L-arabinose transferase-like glycosyltransferase
VLQREIDCERCGDVEWTGTWFFPRGGVYMLFLESKGRSAAALEIDGQPVVRTDTGGPKQRELGMGTYGAGAHAVRVRHQGDGALRLFWIPPGRRCDPEYVPAAALRPAPPDSAGPMPSDLSYREEAAAFTITLIALAGIAFGLSGVRLPQRWWLNGDVLAGAAVFSAALAMRFWRFGEFGQTWDEDCYWSGGRNYLVNLARLDFRPDSWAWNHEHPPVAKYLIGLAALWHDGYGPARAMEALLGAATCALVFRIGRDLFSRRVGLGAALLYAFLPPAVAHSQITGLETPSTFFATLAFHGFVRGHYLRAGVAGGLATASRFIAGLVFVAMAAGALVERPRDRRAFLRLAAAPLVGMLTLVAVWPRLWIEGPLAGLRASLGKLNVQHAPEWFLGEIIQAPVPKTYFLAYFAACVTPALLIGLALSWLRRDRATAVCAAFFLAPFALAFSPVVQNGVRYILPALPPAALLAASGIDAAARRVRWRRAPEVALGVAAAASAVSCLQVVPYPLDYYNVLFGGPRAAFEKRRFLIGWWGEGIASAVRRLNATAGPRASVFVDVYPGHVVWLREDLRVVEQPAEAEYALVNHFQFRQPPAGFREVFREEAGPGAPLAAVYVRER